MAILFSIIDIRNHCSLSKMIYKKLSSFSNLVRILKTDLSHCNASMYVDYLYHRTFRPQEITQKFAFKTFSDSIRQKSYYELNITSRKESVKIKIMTVV